MKLIRTRTATRRSGDDYQDLVAAGAMLRFLENPSLYQWIKLDAIEGGKLDDVVALSGSIPVATVFNVNRNERLPAVSHRTTGSRV